MVCPTKVDSDMLISDKQQEANRQNAQHSPTAEKQAGAST